MKNVETLEMVDEIFDDMFGSEVFEIEVALAVGVNAIAIRLQAFDDLLPNGGSGFFRVVHATYKIRCRLIPWQVGISFKKG